MYDSPFVLINECFFVKCINVHSKDELNISHTLIFSKKIINIRENNHSYRIETFK